MSTLVKPAMRDHIFVWSLFCLFCMTSVFFEHSESLPVLVTCSLRLWALSKERCCFNFSCFLYRYEAKVTAKGKKAMGGGRGGAIREKGGGSREASRHTSWINKSNQWLSPHLKVLGRLKQKCLKSWNICQTGWANTVRITTEEMSAAPGPKWVLSNCCFLENHNSQLLNFDSVLSLWGRSPEKSPAGSFFFNICFSK